MTEEDHAIATAYAVTSHINSRLSESVIGGVEKHTGAESDKLGGALSELRIEKAKNNALQERLQILFMQLVGTERENARLRDALAAHELLYSDIHSLAYLVRTGLPHGQDGLPSGEAAKRVLTFLKDKKVER